MMLRPVSAGPRVTVLCETCGRPVPSTLAFADIDATPWTYYCRGCRAALDAAVQPPEGPL